MIELKALQGQVKALVEDLRGQVPADAGLGSELHKEYEDAKSGQRTGGTFESWLEDVLDQAAVAWVLGCVFVRFCEDNGLVDGLWLGGPEPQAPVERALHHRQAYLIANPRDNDRHWLRQAFGYLRSLRATGKIFDDHNPVWRFGISGQAAEDLSGFFRRGEGLRSLRSPRLDTQFLGDLYQHLSTHAQKTYALLQTPEFVRDFILDRAFEPAYREFGLAGTAVIDPTCGSGHFLLSAFDRLVTRWKERAPATDVRDLVQRALHQVTGVDINPFAVAIARFRLMVAALNACGLSSLERAPAFEVRVATGDSLLPWAGEAAMEQTDVFLWQTEKPFAYTSEDEDLLADYLKPRQYTAVVGNPPYISVRDHARNQKYRELYSACSGKYQLTVPFAQRFFGLARRSDDQGDGAGYVGQITGNGFMKREFGKKLINDYFAHKVELTEVIDASGAIVPGHSTAPVVLIGRPNDRRRSATVRVLFGLGGESPPPSDPAKGRVWAAIVHQIDRPGGDSEWINAADVPREQFATHPWSLSGGGAHSLVDKITHAGTPLRLRAHRIGIFGMTNADDVMLADRQAWHRHVGDTQLCRHLVVGDAVRDWSCRETVWVFFPYDSDLNLLDLPKGGYLKWLWPCRTILGNRATFGKETYFVEGRPWHEWHQITLDPAAHEWWIVWGEVTTHNHFVLDRGGKVFKQTAPVIKLPEGSTEEDHLCLLGVLNSSAACFWLKQVCQSKGNATVSSGMPDQPWSWNYAFNSTKVGQLPLPSVPAHPIELSCKIDRLAQRLAALTPAAVAASSVPTRHKLAEARAEYTAGRAQMVALQEELDWEVYRVYGLLDEELTTTSVPALEPGERAFEIVLARQISRGGVSSKWFSYHGFAPITELPADWPEEYKALVERRIAVIESDRNIKLIERPECKRRWSSEGWDAMQIKALRGWLLDRLEASELWGGAPTPLSVVQLADRVRHDDDFRSVLDLWVGSDQHDLVKTLGKLVADEHVPFLPAQRYKPSGLRTRAQWERTWRQQRQEDAGAMVNVDVPPKYASADFVKGSYWRNRGKLDVPKERFISYPDLGQDGDGTMLFGWAGWDHLAQAQALATVYLDRKTQAAWPAEKLLPILAGLAELEPWLRQWHAEPRPGFLGTPAEFFTGLIDTELAELGADRATLTTLRGVEELG